MLPVGTRRWQKVADAHDKKPRESTTDEHDDHFITDKTRLLTVESSSACILVDVHQTQGNGVDAAQECEVASQKFTWRCTQHMLTTENPELRTSNQSKRTHIRNSACPPLPLKKHCNHASWQGFKQLLRKQFTPPFPFGKGVVPLEEMQDRRQRRIEGAMQRTSTGKVLGSRTNLVELRKLDAKIQNGINKSAFVSSSRRGRSKENSPCNHFQSLGTTKSMKLGSKENFVKRASVNVERIELIASKDESTMPMHSTKENKIFRKVRGQAKKDNVVLLANAME